MTAVRGWCPSAHRPMLSGDGLIVRVRPKLARLSIPDMQVLCDLAERFGNGIIDLTSRGNLQLRGVSEADHPELLAGLIEAGLVAADPMADASVTVAPDWRPGDLTARLGAALEARLNELPDLPGKMSVVLDTGPARKLSDISGDFRFEQGDGGLILRADGARLGRPVTESGAIDALIEMATWFLSTGGRENGRMGRHLARTALPEAWHTAVPVPDAGRLHPGGAVGGRVFGVPFGQTFATALRALMAATETREVGVTPWRSLLLLEAKRVDVPGFLSAPDALLDVAACPGAPHCSQASVQTRALARALAGRATGTLHVSGCAKGCARQAVAAITLVGREGRFDLVERGRAGDTPIKTGLSEPEILALWG